MFSDAPDRDYTVAIATQVAELKRKSALAAGGLLPQYQSATTVAPPAPTAQELADYDVIAGYRTLASGARQPVAWNRASAIWQDSGLALALQSGVDANRSAIGNLLLSALATKSAVDGPQFVDGNRWKSQATGSATIDGGIVVAGTGCIWAREYSGDLSAAWYGVVGDGVTDDYAALQAWATAGKSLGYSVRLFLPPRTNYRVSQALHFEGEYVIIDLQGIIRPFGSYTGYLVDIGPLSTALGANIQSVSVFGAGIWQKRVSVENLTVDCEWKCRGVTFRLIDHFENSRVYVRRSLGTAVSIDRCREGDWYGLKMYHCKQGSDRAILDFYDSDVAGDASNTMSFYGLEVVWCYGRYVSFDSNPTFAASAGYFPPRFINFYGAHIEDIFKAGQAFELAGSPGYAADNKLYPDPTIDRIWIRRGYNINFFGGTLNSGDISTGSVVRLGDASLTEAVRRVRFQGVNIFAFDAVAGAVAVKMELTDEVDVGTVNWWLGANVTRISYGAGSNQLPTNSQGQAYTLPSSKAAVSIRATDGTTDSPYNELIGGQGFSGNLRHRFAGGLGRLLFNPDTRTDHQFAFDGDGNIYSEGGAKKPVWLGRFGGNEAGGAYLKTWAANPPVGTGAVVLCSPPGFDPLALGGTTPYQARYNGTGWESVTGANVKTQAAPTNLAASPTAADFNSLLALLKTARVLS